MVPRVDAHFHLWCYRADELPWIDGTMQTLARDFLPAEAAALMMQEDISAGIAVQARPQTEETDWLLDWADTEPGVAGIVGWADLSAPGFSALMDRWCTRPTFVGLRPMLQDMATPGVLMADPTFNHGVGILQRRGKVFDLLLRSPQLNEATEFCARHDRHWLILDHAGKPDIRNGEWDGWLRRLRQLAALPHVACKLSGLVTQANWRTWRSEGVARYAQVIMELFGPYRVIFGSDWPVCTLAADYGEVVSVAHAAMEGYSKEERAAMFGGNAISCYGLQLSGNQ